MKIAVIVAMEKEQQQLQQLFADNPQVVVTRCGIGKVNAALGAADVINRCHPDVVISSGCAGGNGDEVQVKDVVVSTELAYHDVYCGKAIDNDTQYGQVQGMPARYQGDGRLLAIAEQLKGQQTSARIHMGLIVTGDWFVDSKEKMRNIIGLFPDAKAVDMESAAIAQTCYKMGVPFVSYRVISDIPLRDPNASQYHDFWDQVAETSFQTTRHFVEALLEQGF